MTLTSVELFAGAGGLGLGLTLAGFQHRAVIEWNQWACDTIRRNQRFGHELVAEWPLFQGDVRAFDFASVSGPIDLVAGGPPCQPFSLGGKHRAHGDRRDMFPALAEAVRHLRPRAFIVENVKGLTRPAFAEYLAYVIARLTWPELTRAPDESWTDHLRRLRRHRRGGGARYLVSFRVLNGADYGVPQKRERVFIVGLRDDVAGAPDWVFPEPTHSLAALLADQAPGGSYWDRHGLANPNRGAHPIVATRDDARRRPWRTVRDAVADLPDPEFEPVAARRYFDHRFQPGVRFYPGHTGSVLDLPAKTLKAGDHGVPGGENALLRPDGGGRYFTVREAARLQTFPDNYVFGGSWSEVMRQLGNAVPVALANVVGTSIARHLAADENAATGTAAIPELAASG